jgi:general secretion pathway protein G
MWSKPMHTPQKSRPLRAAQGGFSLIEILIVVALIALIAGMVANQVFGGRSRANVKLAQSDLASLAAKVEQFEMDTGVLPQRLEDLVKESALRDPWNTPYEYRVPGDGAPFAIISYGDDKKPGGSGVDADLSSAD